MENIKNFEEYIETINESNVVKYRWREAFNNVWHETRCEVISHNDKTAQIKLLEFGKNNKRPGTVMRVQLKSLIGFKVENPTPQSQCDDEDDDDYRWKKYTYFD